MSKIQYIEPQQETTLYADVCQIIDGARGRIATYVNTEACMTNILSATQRQLTWTHLKNFARQLPSPENTIKRIRKTNPMVYKKE